MKEALGKSWGIAGQCHCQRTKMERKEEQGNDILSANIVKSRGISTAFHDQYDYDCDG
jgi:hypothetical protein